MDDDFAVGAKLERQAVCKALVKLNLCGVIGAFLKISLGTLCHKPHCSQTNPSTRQFMTVRRRKGTDYGNKQFVRFINQNV
ncbi:MAG: hypothetical protein ACLTYW_10780 [Collinsella sp.]